MNTDEKIKQFIPFYRRNEHVIQKIAWQFYAGDTYRYEEFYSLLVEHLWMAYSSLPEGTVLRSESQWVGLVLFRRAVNLYHTNVPRARNEIVDYVETLDDVPDIDNSDPLIRRLNVLVANLDDSDKDFVELYLEGLTIHEIASWLNVSYMTALRRLRGIEKQLRELNSTLEEEEDFKV